MLHSFPSPYPDELWYSVIGRFCKRGGSMQMFRRMKYEVPHTTFYDESMSVVEREVPNGLFQVEDIMKNHTLFPYVSRILPKSKKEQWMQDIISGNASVMKWKTTVRTVTSLRYCPICKQEELKYYGESYWHREHQLPFVTMCSKHGCRLKTATTWKKEKGHFPELIEDKDARTVEMIPNEKKLAKTSIEYLIEPFEVGPINEVSNLYRALEEGNYSAVRRCELKKVDPVRLHMRLLEMYGNNLVTRYFGNQITSGTIEGIKNWKFTAPERYIMLTVLLEQDLMTSFGITMEHDNKNFGIA